MSDLVGNPKDMFSHDSAQIESDIFLMIVGIGKLSTADGKALTDPEVLRKLTSSVSCALDEAAQALHRMRAEQQLGAIDTYVLELPQFSLLFGHPNFLM